MNALNEIFDELDLAPHPEGGFFRETYRSAGEINSDSLEPEYSGNRAYSTCIYFLLTSAEFSAFHRILQDEIWHFYDGSPIRLHMISESGEYTQHIIGRNFSHGEKPQLIVPGGSWFASEVMDKDSYSLVGCTVAPGFNFDDFELVSRSKLTGLFPEHEQIIASFTRMV